MLFATEQLKIAGAVLALNYPLFEGSICPSEA
jgi:hypothetical protein